MSMDLHQIAAHRGLWNAAVVAILEQYWEDHRRVVGAQARGGVLARARAYFRSNDGQTVLGFAGVGLTDRTETALIAAITAPLRPRIGGADPAYRAKRREKVS